MPSSPKLLVLFFLLSRVKSLEESYVSVQVPSTYWTEITPNYKRTKGDCAFDCTMMEAECTAFSFENDHCQLAKVLVPDDSSNFVPAVNSDADARTILIKKRNIDLNAMKATSLGYFDVPDIEGTVYNLVMDDQNLKGQTVVSEVGGPFFAVHAYKKGLLACGGAGGDKLCR